MEAGVSLKGFDIISCERANYNSLIFKDLSCCLRALKDLPGIKNRSLMKRTHVDC